MMKTFAAFVGAIVFGIIGAIIGALLLARTNFVFPGLGLIVSGSLIGVVFGFVLGAPIGLVIGYIMGKKPAKFD